MNKTLLALVVVLWFFASLMFSAFPNQVSADSTSSISFVDSGVTVFSPVNMTYYYHDLILNLSLYSAGNLGSLDPNISMNYSIDGSYNGSVPLKSNGEIHIVTSAIGTVFLPDLPDGSHTLTLYLYGLNQRTYEPKYLTFTNTVYFSTEGNPVLSSTLTLSSSPSPAVPEFPSNTSQPTSSLSATPFTPKTVFPITPNNGTIRFAYNGSYTNATLENNTWLFQNLIVNNYTISHIPAWSLAISTQNSNVTITSYSAGALTGLLDAAAWLNYTVVGNGSQTVNLNYDAIAGQTNLFVVYIDGVNRTHGSSWTVSDTLALTISGATSNVSIYYPPNTFFDSFPPPSPSPSTNIPSPSIPEFHSLIILSLIMATVIVSVIIAKRNRTRQSSLNKQKQAID